MNDKEAQLIWESYDNKTKAVVKEAIEKHVRKHDNSGFPLTEAEWPPTGRPTKGNPIDPRIRPRDVNVVGRQTDHPAAAAPPDPRHPAPDAVNNLSADELQEVLQLIVNLLSGEATGHGQGALFPRLIQFYVSNLYTSQLQGSVSNWLDTLVDVTEGYGIGRDEISAYLDEATSNWGSDEPLPDDPRDEARKAYDIGQGGRAGSAPLPHHEDPSWDPRARPTTPPKVYKSRG